MNGPFEVCKFDHWVILHITARNSSNSILGTIPSGYRPVNSIWAGIYSYSDDKMILLEISNTGEISFPRGRSSDPNIFGTIIYRCN